jgi:hypothetical protein
VHEVTRFLLEIGRSYAVFAVQTDGEPAIKALSSAIVKALPNATLRSTPAYSHESNGSIERFHHTIMAQFRVLKATVQRMYGVVIRPHDLITGWMLRHATWLITRYLTHADGLTSYQRRWDRQFSSPLCVFGETVQTKLSVKRANKYEGDWRTGIWLGRDSETNEHLIALDSGVIRSRTVRRFPEPEQYQLQVYRAMKGTLWNLKTDSGTFQLTFNQGTLFHFLRLISSNNRRLQDRREPTRQLTLATLRRLPKLKNRIWTSTLKLFRALRTSRPQLRKGCPMRMHFPIPRD